jgi:hypothetical protein
MRMCAAIAVILVGACTGKRDETRTGAGTGAGTGTGTAANDAAAAVDAVPAVDATVRLRQAAEGKDWRLAVSFGDTPSLFDPTADDLATLAIEVTDASGAPLWRRSGFAAIAPGVEPPTQCEQLQVTAAPERWGELEGARVSLVCANGEDVRTASEIAILVVIPEPVSPSISILWAGAADDARSEHGCSTTTTVRFAVKGTILTQEIAGEVERLGGAPAACRAKKTSRKLDVAVRR